MIDLVEGRAMTCAYWTPFIHGVIATYLVSIILLILIARAAIVDPNW